jgi:hypothetical protein
VPREKDQALKEVKSSEMSAREAFFAMVGIKMMELSERYSKTLEDLHTLFYSVSCDWGVLE